MIYNQIVTWTAFAILAMFSTVGLFPRLGLRRFCNQECKRGVPMTVLHCIIHSSTRHHSFLLLNFLTPHNSQLFGGFLCHLGPHINVAYSTTYLVVVDES